MIVQARDDLLMYGLTPKILGSVKEEIDWYNDLFYCYKPSVLEGEKIDIVLKHHKFTRGIAFGSMIDFELVIGDA